MDILSLLIEQFDEINSKLDLILEQRNDSKEKKKEWLSSNEVAELLGISRSTLWRYCKEQKLEHHRINRRLYFNAREVNQLIQNS